jgi:hypothetical protein
MAKEKSAVSGPQSPATSEKTLKTGSRSANLAQATKKSKPEGILVVRGSIEKYNEVIKDGWVGATFFIESHGNDQDTVAEALKNTILKDLKNETGVVLKELKFHPVVEQAKLYAGFAEVNFAARDPQIFMYLSIRYGPSAVEIHSPDSIMLTAAELQNMGADASSAVQTLVGRILEMMAPEDRVNALKKGLELS